MRRVSVDGSAEPVERSLHHAGRTDRITFESATSVGTGEGDGLMPSAPWLLDIGQWGAEAQWSAYVLSAPRPQAERVQYAGEDCVLLRWAPAAGGEARAWIAPAKSFLVVRRESRTPADRDGYKERIYNVVLDAVAEPTKGVWLPWRYRVLNGYTRTDNTIDWRTMDRIEATHIRVNPNQEGIAFQYGALPGARVYHTGVEGNVPVYGGDPTPLLAALQVPWDPVAQIAPCERIEVIAEPGSRGNW